MSDGISPASPPPPGTARLAWETGSVRSRSFARRKGVSFRSDGFSLGFRRCSFPIHRFSLQAQAPAGQHLVTDRVFQLRDVVYGDFLVALAAHDDRFVPHLRL